MGPNLNRRDFLAGAAAIAVVATTGTGTAGAAGRLVKRPVKRRIGTPTRRSCKCAFHQGL